MRFKASEPGLPVSIATHAGLFLVGVLTFGQPSQFEDAQESIAVDVISESQLREITRGERTAKQVVPNTPPRVDRIAEKKEESDPGEAKVQATPLPVKQEAQDETALVERRETTASTSPPPLPPLRPVIPPKPVEPAKAAKAAATETEEAEEAEEAIRQAKLKKLEQQKAEEQKRDDEQRKLEEARKAEEARRLELARKLEELKKAEEVRKVEEAKKAELAAKKAEAERKKREQQQAEAQSKATLDAVRQRLALSKETPSSSGNTGVQITRTASLGTATGTGQKLSPSDRDALASLIADQIRACWSIPPTTRPTQLPRVRLTLNPDGSLGASPALVNTSNEPGFQALADSGMRAIRQCAPLRIPARYAAMYDDWRSNIVRLDPDN